MGFSARTKTGLAVTALLPVLASIYGEHQQQAAQRQQRREAAQRAEVLRSDQERLLDRASADALRGAIEAAIADPALRAAAGGEVAERAQALCLRLFMASELLRLGQYAGQTANVLAATLSYRLESGDPARPGAYLACQCKATLRRIVDSWKQPNSAPAPALFIQALDAADLACADAAPGTGAPAREPLLDSLRARALSPAPVRQAPPRAAVALAGGCPAPAPQATGLRPRLFFHTPSRARDQPLFDCLSKELTQLGYRVEGLEAVRTAPRAYEVRYVYAQAEAEARRLADNLAALGASCGEPWPPGQCPRLTAIPQYANRVLPNSLEVWLPAEETP